MFEILEDSHFNRLAAIIRVPFLSKRWRAEHTDVPLWTLIQNFNNVTPVGVDWNKDEVIGAFTNLITTITNADTRLTYKEDDLAWFIDILDDNGYQATVKMLQAWYSAPDTLLTPAEVANATGTAESTWRNKAARGKIPGATKKGKQWLLPRSILRSQGVNV